MYKSKSEREDARWMTDDEAIQRIVSVDACSEGDARDQLAKLKADYPAIARVKYPPGGSGPATIPRIVVLPHQVLRAEIDRHWPQSVLGTPPAAATVGAQTLPERMTDAAREKRDVPRIDYSAADAPIIAEMRLMIDRGEAKDATDAARALVDKAAGNGNETSKVRRLVSRFHAGPQ